MKIIDKINKLFIMTNLPPINVAIADSHILFRTGLKAAMGSHPEIKMIAEADNGRQLLNLIRHLRPDVVLLDLHMPVMDGQTTLLEIKNLYPKVKVIMMIDKNDHKQIAHLMEIGANSCIAKTWDAGEFVKAINAVQTDEFYFNEIVNTALLENTKMKNNMKLLVPVVHLSDKEITYLKLLYEEKSIKEMAVTMELSPRTVEAIRDKLKTKLGVTSTPGLVKYTIKARIVELEIPVHS